MPITAYCYVDESGLCENGEEFIVGMVITGHNKEDYRNVCKRIEQESGKGKKKWSEATYSRKLDYVQQIISNPLFRGCLMYATFQDTKNYDNCKLRAIAAGLKNIKGGRHDAVVLIDAWPQRLEQYAMITLRQLDVHPKKVRGIAKEQNDELLRLADALCGLTHGAYRGNTEMVKLLGSAIAGNIIIQLSDC